MVDLHLLKDETQQWNFNFCVSSYYLKIIKKNYQEKLE